MSVDVTGDFLFHLRVDLSTVLYFVDSLEDIETVVQ